MYTTNDCFVGLANSFANQNGTQQKKSNKRMRLYQSETNEKIQYMVNRFIEENEKFHFVDII